MSEACLSFGLLGFLLAWPCTEMDVTGGEGWTLHPRLDQEEEAREGKVCCDAKKTISEAASCLALSPSRSMGQWQRCVRTMAAVVETWVRQPAIEIVVENKEGMNILGRPVAPTCRTDPDTIALETAIELCNIPFSGGSFPSLPAVELSQDSGTTGLCVPPGLATGWAQPGRVIRFC